MSKINPEQSRGSAFIIVLAFMAISVPLVTGALGLASTLNVDSRLKTGITKGQYSALGGDQDALYRILYENGFTDSIPLGSEITYTVTLNGEEIEITVAKLSDPVTDPPPPNSDNSRRIQTSKSVAPESAPVDTLTTFTYTIIAENRDNEPESLRKIYDVLPNGFSYLAGSTTGVTTDDPTVTLVANPSGGAALQQLVWNLASMGITLSPGDSKSLVFEAQANVPEGIYCNEAWVSPGDEKTSTGLTAKVTVGSPASPQYNGKAVDMTSVAELGFAPGDSFTVYPYTLTFENTGTEVLELTQVRELLPVGSSYIPGSTFGDLTFADPTITTFQGQERLDWDFVPSEQILPGEVKTLYFEAEASLEPGKYYKEVWLSFNQFTNPVYSWPTALVEAMGVLETQATNGGTTSSSEVWVGSDSYVITGTDLLR